MKRYWDYTERERSEMTSEQVEQLLAVELMEKGVARVDPPILDEVDKVEVPKRTFYGVKHAGRYGSEEAFDCVFDTADQADAFLALKPKYRSHDYSIGAEYDTAMDSVLSLASFPLCQPQDVTNVKSRIEKSKSAKSANDKKLDDYSKALKTVTSATEGVWEDWRNLRQQTYDMRKVIVTFDEYIRICDGDRDKAKTFLLKAFSEESVGKAFEWFADVLANESFGTAAVDEVAPW